MKVTARTDHALRALVELGASRTGAVPLATIADRQGLSAGFLEHIFADLRRAGLVESRRGGHGGYRLARPSAAISVADVIAAIHPDHDQHPVGRGPVAGAADSDANRLESTLTSLWRSFDDNVHTLLASVTLAHLIDGELPTLLTGS